jgi:flagellar motor switch protein FliN/FliY
MADPNQPNEGEVELPDLSDEAKAVGTDVTADKPPEGEEQTQKFATDLQAVYDVHVSVSAVLGKTQMEVSELLKLGRGAIVELDRKIGEAIDIYVNNRLVARGEVVVVEDRLGITMTEIVKGGMQ